MEPKQNGTKTIKMPAKPKNREIQKHFYFLNLEKSASLEETEPDKSALLQGENVAIAEDSANTATVTLHQGIQNA